MILPLCIYSPLVKFDTPAFQAATRDARVLALIFTGKSYLPDFDCEISAQVGTACGHACHLMLPQKSFIFTSPIGVDAPSFFDGPNGPQSQQPRTQLAFPRNRLELCSGCAIQKEMHQGRVSTRELDEQRIQETESKLKLPEFYAATPLR